MKRLCCVLAAFMVASVLVSRLCCAQDSGVPPVLDGEWLMTAVFENVEQETLTISTLPPLLTVRSDSGYCAPGIVLSKTDGYILLWRFHTLRTTGWYKGSTRRDPCSSSGTDTETVIAGTVALYSRAAGTRRGTFTAYRRTMLRVAVTPEGSGSVVSDSDAVSCGEDCVEQYTGGCRTVTLTAQPAAGWAFHAWQIGDEIVSDNPLVNLRVNADLNVLAVFVEADR